VLDIVEELDSYGCNLIIHDPICDPEDAKEEHKIKLCQEAELKCCSAVVVAVAHKAYRTWAADRWQNMLAPGGVFIDVKGIVPIDEFKALGIKFWRL